MADSSDSESIPSFYSKDGIQIVEERGAKKPSRSCCGVLSKAPSSVDATIPWQDVLSASSVSTAGGKEEDAIEVTYVKHASSDEQAQVYPAQTTILLPTGTDSADGVKIAQSIVKQAYPYTQYRKRILVLVNPFGGKGNGAALRKYQTSVEPVLRAAKCKVTMIKTTHRGHAVEVARDMDIDEYDVVACCSGDGVPHEVFNGFAKRPDARRALAKIAVVQMPCGSGNAMSWNCFRTGTPSLAALRMLKSHRTPMDLVSVTHQHPEKPDEIVRTMSFLTQAVGVIADCDLGTEHLRFLGESRFALGLVWKICTKQAYPCDIAIAVEMDDKERIREHARALSEANPDYLDPEPREAKAASPGLPALEYGTVGDELPAGWELVPYDRLANFYCGNMIQVQNESPMFPTVLPADGLMDLITISADIPIGDALGMFDDCPKNKVFDSSYVRYRKIKGFRLIPRNQNGFIAVDGEPIPHGPFQAEIHQKLATTLTLSGRVYEGPGIPTRPSSRS